ncbi:MAG TPA: hypothetical protein ENN67_08010 [Firmicutes bacterium]|mgnify:CR=1 FL=1|nr:hypothetical protein [Bacillota bacterium]
MRPKTLKRTILFAILSVIACGILGSGLNALPMYEIDREKIMMPSIYEKMPGLWDLLNQNRIEWTSVSETDSEPNNDKDHAMTITGNVIISGSVSETTDQNDYYKVTWTEPTSMFVKLTWLGSAWLNVYIYDSNLNPITYLNENTPSPKHLSMWQYNSGTFYIRVRAAAGSSNYTLKVGTAGQIGEPDNDAFNTTGLSISPLNVPIRSVVCTSADPVDFFSVTIPEGCTGATISLDWFGSQDANLDFAIYGPNGVELHNVAASTDFETLYSQDVPANTYYIAVKAVYGRAMYQLVVDAEIDVKIFIPRFPIEYERRPWDPPFPFFDDIRIKNPEILHLY